MNAKALQQKYSKQLEELLKRPENRNCADCWAPGTYFLQSRKVLHSVIVSLFYIGPTFASTNLGIFICMRCAGLHRKMGVHISKIKSVSHDAWQPDQVQVIFINWIFGGRLSYPVFSKYSSCRKPATRRHMKNISTKLLVLLSKPTCMSFGIFHS